MVYQLHWTRMLRQVAWGCLRLLEVAWGCLRLLEAAWGYSEVAPKLLWGCSKELPKGCFKVSRDFDPKRKLQHKLMRLSSAVCSLKVLISIGIWDVVGLQRKATPNLLYKYIYLFDLELGKKLFCQVFLGKYPRKPSSQLLCQLFLPRQFPIISKLIKQRKMNTNHDNKNVN